MNSNSKHMTFFFWLISFQWLCCLLLCFVVLLQLLIEVTRITEYSTFGERAVSSIMTPSSEALPRQIILALARMGTSPTKRPAIVRTCFVAPGRICVKQIN